MPHVDLSFATPRKLPKARDLKGRVVVVDLAFASEASGGGFEKLTGPFIEALGSRLIGWVDHHDHQLHAKFAGDPRFVLSTKQENGACPEMVTPGLVARIGMPDTIVCHTDFDGLCSAAKWLRAGEEPYPGADADARAIDTRIGSPGPAATRIDRALRAHPRDAALFGVIVRHLASGLADASLWSPIDAAAAELAKSEVESRRIAGRYKILDVRRPPLPAVRSVAFVDATVWHGSYEKTLLLLLGQERGSVAIVLDRDTLTLAAPFNSGLNFLSLLGLSGGMPTLVSVGKERAGEALGLLGVEEADVLSAL